MKRRKGEAIERVYVKVRVEVSLKLADERENHPYHLLNGE